MAKVTAALPEATPLFIRSANDDPIAALSSASAYSKWKGAGSPLELHICAKGGHGFGMNKQGCRRTIGLSASANASTDKTHSSPKLTAEKSVFRLPGMWLEIVRSATHPREI
jgi:hypothetical protein